MAFQTTSTTPTQLKRTFIDSKVSALQTAHTDVEKRLISAIKSTNMSSELRRLSQNLAKVNLDDSDNRTYLKAQSEQLAKYVDSSEVFKKRDLLNDALELLFENASKLKTVIDQRLAA